MEFLTQKPATTFEASKADSLEDEIISLKIKIDEEELTKKNAEAKKRLEVARKGADMVEGNQELNQRTWNSGMMGNGLREIEQKQLEKISSLRTEIDLNAEKIARLKMMVADLKSADKETGEFEKKIALVEEELLRRRELLVSYETEYEQTVSTNRSLRIAQERIAYKPVEFAAETMAATPKLGMEQKEIKGDISMELERRENESERMKREERDRELLAKYENKLTKVRKEFEQLKSELDHEKSEWEADYNSTESGEQVRQLKDSLKESFKEGLFSRFTKKSRLEKAQKSLEGLKVIDGNFQVSSVDIYNKWLNFSNKTVSKAQFENDDSNLLFISRHLLTETKKNSEIGKKMDEIEQATESLIKEIGDCRERYDLKYDEKRILNREEGAQYELKIRDLSLK